MRWLGRTRLIAPATVAGALVWITATQPSRPLRVAVPISVVTAITGLSLLLAPALASSNLFQVLLLPVLVAALGVGLRSGLLTVAVAAVVVTVAAAPFGMRWVDDPLHLPALGLFVAEGGMMAFIGAVVRAAMRTALGPSASPVREDPADRSGAPEAPRPVGALLVEHLTPRETEVLQLAAAGRSVEELAAELCVSTNTVKTHLAHCYGKLGAHNRAEAVALAVHSGMLQPADLDAALDGAHSAS